MAYLKEDGTWEAGIYQLETSDPVMGGENGIDNLPAKQLANRTVYLKSRMDNELQPLLGFTPIQQGGGANQKVNKIYIGWTGSFLTAQVDNNNLGPLVTQSWIDTALTGKQDKLGYTPIQQGGGTGQTTTNKIYLGWSGSRLKAQVDTSDLGNVVFDTQLNAAIAGVVGGAPTALDTLKELAAAIGNDANFATTITNALAGKQASLGYTPIQQGGGTGQKANKLYIGWTGSGIKAQVDTTDLGTIVFQSQLDAALSNLVGGAPGALDTLKELSTALGNDANFATTITNALAGKQASLGYTPIQQGGGTGQTTTNKIHMGWSGSRLKVQVDASDLGNVVFDNDLNGAFSSRIAVLTGTIGHGGTIPLPAGFAEDQCKWMVSMASDNPTKAKWDIDESGGHMHYRFECNTTGRLVTAKVYRGDGEGSVESTANYMIIGVK